MTSPEKLTLDKSQKHNALKMRKAAGKSQLPNPLKPLVELMGIEPTTL